MLHDNAFVVVSNVIVALPVPGEPVPAPAFAWAPSIEAVSGIVAAATVPATRSAAVFPNAITSSCLVKRRTGTLLLLDPGMCKICTSVVASIEVRK
jgi:hypothetical protein